MRIVNFNTEAPVTTTGASVLYGKRGLRDEAA
jgi:hypothetical protein